MNYTMHNRTQNDPAFAVLPTSGNPGVTAVILADDRIGDSGEHGGDLIEIFLRGLCERSTLPDLLLIYGRGVFLTEAGHPAIPIFEKLLSYDVTVKVCEESLKEYAKEPAVSEIQPVPMSEITQDILKANRVIRP